MNPFVLAILLAIFPLLAQGEEDIAFVLKGSGGKNYLRLVTAQPACPQAVFDGKEHAATARATPGKGFPVLTCEAEVPAGTQRISAGSLRLPAPVREPGRIVVIGDTGCRMKSGTFQDCNDPRQWPFKAISDAAAAFKPDLVIHVGDYLYRESPCPKGSRRCSMSPYGDDFDTWHADFFAPAKKLLEAAPWVFVRGNHEDCSRAGEGWFRFLAQGPYRDCGSFSAPYSIPISPDTQLIVFDSSANASGDQYRSEFETVARLAGNMPHSFFLSHHPILGFSEWQDRLYPGTASLQSAMRQDYRQNLFPVEVDAAFHGHVHLFEALDFKSGYPVTFVSGNSGTETDEALPKNLPESAEPFPGAIVKDFFSTANFGFMTLERKADGWLVTERDSHGKAAWSCVLRGRQCR